MSGGCPICRKHKYTIIFYQQEDSEIAISDNKGLVEIKEKEIINQIKEDMNLLPLDEQDIAPIICGTVVNGGFSRKLRMLRADIYSMLTVCHSSYFIQEYKQINKIKGGLLANVTKSQDLNGRDESVEFLKGWHRHLINDKCLNNETTDVAVINMPHFVDHLKDRRSSKPKAEMSWPSKKCRDEDKIDQNCKTYVYAAYLPPGMHQFIIYCPKTSRAFCKDIVIDLNASDYWPEYPEPFRLPKDSQKAKKVTRSNVWRKWRDDSEEDIQMAFLADCTGSFSPDLFIKNAEDIEECKKLLHANFHLIQIAYLEALAKSQNTYPEISWETFINKMLE